MNINLSLKHILPLSLLLLMACVTNVNASPQHASTFKTLNSNVGQQPHKETIAQQKMINYARKNIGIPYVWGGTSPSGFDCSGFIKYIYNHFNISIPRTTAAYTQLFKHSISLKDAKVGDLIVFTGTNLKIRRPGHAGIITEIKPGLVKFIHSSSSKKHFGVTETSYYQSGYPKRYLTVIRMPNPTIKE
ncbi:hydrolase [Photobacterium aquimaris]|uniref:NlpC/P60 family protein n=1 Tax=Photobacterium aquimaris TaxID=512643 RepID=A0A2T3IHH6_9GAMM|nr:C40 family peptidase [Photobacterium aquimaris]OBU15967.1 hydrolase [Photobacterium aquimaris]OBU20456.1 hydrolase [Photobacterium aquimaris]PSU27098.1 NlpC/P60 family protein [Photobacterium aquimaris]PSV98525.1 NlpC/P60 family protein [Photobacterium aquimaris]